MRPRPLERECPVAKFLALVKRMTTDAQVRAGPVARRREQNLPMIFPGPLPDRRGCLLPVPAPDVQPRPLAWQLWHFWRVWLWAWEATPPAGRQQTPLLREGLPSRLLSQLLLLLPLRQQCAQLQLEQLRLQQCGQLRP